MSILFIFLDGVGLGDDDAKNNPFATVNLPTLTRFTRGRRWLRDLPRIESDDAVFIPIDATLGVAGRPQSATGQATLLTGLNVSQMIGRHYGPKPNPEITAILEQNNLFKWLAANGQRTSFLNAYPPSYFEDIDSGRRLLAAIPLAVRAAGITLFGREALIAGRALSADFTGEGWHTYLQDRDAPIYAPDVAGRLMATLASENDFTFFEHWVTDLVGHRGPLTQGTELLEQFDAVFSGLLEIWDWERNLIIITSDHGNLEDLSRRNHTQNPIPTLIVGRNWQIVADGLNDLTGFAPGVRRFLLS